MWLASSSISKQCRLRTGPLNTRLSERLHNQALEDARDIEQLEREALEGADMDTEETAHTEDCDDPELTATVGRIMDVWECQKELERAEYYRN